MSGAPPAFHRSPRTPSCAPRRRNSRNRSISCVARPAQLNLCPTRSSSTTRCRCAWPAAPTSSAVSCWSSHRAGLRCRRCWRLAAAALRAQGATRSALACRSRPARAVRLCLALSGGRSSPTSTVVAAEEGIGVVVAREPQSVFTLKRRHCRARLVVGTGVFRRESACSADLLGCRAGGRCRECRACTFAIRRDARTARRTSTGVWCVRYATAARWFRRRWRSSGNSMPRAERVRQVLAREITRASGGDSQGALFDEGATAEAARSARARFAWNARVRSVRCGWGGCCGGR